MGVLSLKGGCAGGDNACSKTTSMVYNVAMKNEERIAYFRSILPQRINVEVVKNEDDEGVWAKITDLPHCYTQAASTNELPQLITDLVLTHFEVPEEFRKEVGEYLPLSESHLRIEEMCRQLMQMTTRTEAGETVEQTFERARIVLA